MHRSAGRIPVALAALITLAWGGRVEALGIEIARVSSTGSNPSLLSVGDVINIDLVVHNEAHVDVYALYLSAFGYDVDADGIADDGLRMVSVSAASSMFNTLYLPGYGSFLGLPNLHGGREINLFANGQNTGLQIFLFRGVALAPGSGDGSLDLGIDGRLIQEGGVHFRVAFQAMSLANPTDLLLEFGTGGPAATDGAVGAGGSPLPFENAVLRVSILGDPDYDGSGPAVPEPGTGLLIGVGLVALRSARTS